MLERLFWLRMSYDELEGKLRWFIRIRYLATIFGVVLIFLLRYVSGVKFLMLPTLILAVAEILINSSYLHWLNRRLRLNTLAHFQFIVDIFIITVGIYYTEGIDSPFWFGYLTVIIAASVLISFRMSVFVVIASSVAYCSLMILSYLNILPTMQIYINTDPDIARRHMQLDYLLPMTFTRIFFLLATSGLSGYSANIVKQKTKEVEAINSVLIQLKNYTEDIVESIDSGIIVINKDFTITSWNAAMERLTNIRREEVLGQNYFEKFPHLKAASFEKIISDVIQTVRPYETLGREHLTSRRGTLTINRTILPLRDSNDNVTGAVIITEDISEKTRLEKQIIEYNKKLNEQVEMLEKANSDLRRTQEQLLHSEKLAALGQMAAMLAHEIRNPLSVIGGYARIISMKLNAQNPCKSYVDTIVNETDKLENFLKERIDFISPMEGAMEPFAIQDTVEAAIVTVKHKLESHKISWKTDLDPELLYMVMNAPQMVHALIQVLDNSIKAIANMNNMNNITNMTNGGKIEISVRSQEENLNGLTGSTRRWAIIQITDTGGGIPPDLIDRIFDPFFSTDAMSPGLGLTVARKIIEFHNGRINVESQVDVGTTCVIRLPLP